VSAMYYVNSEQKKTDGQRFNSHTAFLRVLIKLSTSS